MSYLNPGLSDSRQRNSAQRKCGGIQKAPNLPSREIIQQGAFNIQPYNCPGKSWLTVIEHLLCAMFFAKHLRYIISLNPPDRFREKNYCAYFIEEETVVQRGPLNCPRLHTWEVLESGL